MVSTAGEGGSATVAQTVFIYDENQIALHFTKSDTGNLIASDLQHRYLFGSQIDQNLADETVTALNTVGTVLWPLCDQINTVRDLANYDSERDRGTQTDYERLGKSPTVFQALLRGLMTPMATWIQ